MKFDEAKLSIEKLKEIQAEAKKARGAILKMTTLAKSGHPGGSLSTIDILLTLYYMIDVDPQNPLRENRDRVIISHGHVSPAVYATLGSRGFFNINDAISQFRLAGSIFEGHVEPSVPGVEWASGNLGQGLSAGCGFALAAKLKKYQNHVFVLMGDGEQQKGQLAEARKFAVKFKLNNLTAIIDYNKLQISGNIDDVMPNNIMNCYLADGWDVIEIDGHNLVEIRNAILDAAENDAPTLILAHTMMGKDISFMENKHQFHGAPISEDQLKLALKELSLEFDLEKFRELRNKFNPVKHPHITQADFDLNTGSPLIYKDKTDNRSSWGNALADLAKNNPKAQFAVFDCDLQGSVKTKGFEEIMPEKFFQSGIMEHNTAVVAAAVSKERIQTFWADFGVFGIDETLNQHRLSDINGTNLKVITTHVGLDVGEDGKTHQCIDYLGLIRNLYHFKTIIPADPNQTDRVIRYIACKYGNYLIPMGRSKLEVLKTKDGRIFFDESYQFEYGKADLLRDGKDAAMFVMGTVTGRAVKAIDLLAEQGIFVQLWNVACPLDLDETALKSAAKTGVVFTYEDHNVHTGLGNCIADKYLQLGLSAEFHKFGVEDYAFSGSSEDVFKACGLDVNSVVERIKAVMK